jgi:hypothetical protein
MPVEHSDELVLEGPNVFTLKVRITFCKTLNREGAINQDRCRQFETSKKVAGLGSRGILRISPVRERTAGDGMS